MALKPGPPPKPAHLRQNRIKRPEIGLVPARIEPRPVPKPPARLLPESRRIWRAYWQSQVSNAADEHADLHRIQRWIRSVDEYERCHKEFSQERIVRGSRGQPVMHPLASYLATLESEITRAEGELGLTPLARLRLGITFGQARLTAMELNRMLDETAPATTMPDLQIVDGEWEAV